MTSFTILQSMVMMVFIQKMLLKPAKALNSVRLPNLKRNYWSTFLSLHKRCQFQCILLQTVLCLFRCEVGVDNIVDLVLEVMILTCLNW